MEEQRKLLTQTETPELIKALAKAQGSFKPAIKDVDNSFFKSRYADLASVWAACAEGLKENGLFVSQQPFYLSDGRTVLRTRVYHESGGHIESELMVTVAKQNDPQSFGSALTYARRYALAAILGIVVDDDDAEGAMARDNGQSAAKTPKNAPQPKPMTPEQRAEILELLKNPAQTQETITRVTGKMDSFNYDAAIKTMVFLKKQIAEAAQQQAESKHGN